MDYDDDCDIHLGKSVKHPLLRKSICGRAPVNATKGIKGDETFGRPSPKGEIGVAGLMNHETFEAEKPPPAERDFVKLNKESAKMGITTARGTYEFRKDHDFRVITRQKKFTSHNPATRDPDFTFGQPTPKEAHDPNMMKAIIEGRFGREWLEEQVDQQETRERSKPPKKQYSVTASAKGVVKRGGLGTSTKHAITDSEEALREKDERQAELSKKMREGIPVQTKLDTHWSEPPKKLPRLKMNWETGQQEEVYE